jgi:hypothetical protein
MTTGATAFASLCLIAFMASNLHAAEIRLEAKVFIEIQAGGKHCVIRKVRVLCADAITHLRDTLKLPAGTEVGVKAGLTAPFKDVKKVLDDVQKSEYVIPVAYLTEPKNDREK